MTGTMRQKTAIAHDDWIKENHEFLMHFLNETSANEEDVTASVKATIVQFLANTRHGLSRCAKNNGGTWVNREQIIEVQIEQLRRCIVDLQQCLNENHGVIN